VSNVQSARKSCWTHPMELLGEWVMWNLVSVRLGTVLVSVQMVCSECTIGSEINLDAPDDTPR
jgi:predicted ABC-type sugar transport system permease subunit